MATKHFRSCMAWQAATDIWAIGREIDFQVVTILRREVLLSITNMVIKYLVWIPWIFTPNLESN